jgi:hypothetical protein
MRRSQRNILHQFVCRPRPLLTSASRPKEPNSHSEGPASSSTYPDSLPGATGIAPYTGFDSIGRFRAELQACRCASVVLIL